MLIRALLIVLAASLMFTGIYYFRFQAAERSIEQLRSENERLQGDLQISEFQRNSAEEAMAVMRVQRAEAERRAREADRIREAILTGDTDEISNIDGSVGDAIRLLRIWDGNPPPDCAPPNPR